MAYNGWSGFETWLVKAYLDEGEGDWNMLVDEILEDDNGNVLQVDEEERVVILASYLKNMLEEEADAADLSDLMHALLLSALANVDYMELAAALLDL